MFVAPFGLPLGAAFVAFLSRAVPPRFEQIQRQRRILRDNQTCVEDAHPLAIYADRAFVAEFFSIPRKGYGRVLFDTPAVEHPLEWNVKVWDCNVGIHYDHELITRYQLAENMG